MESGGAFLWRTPTREQPDAVAAMVRATLEGGEQALVLAPEIGAVERAGRPSAPRAPCWLHRRALPQRSRARQDRRLRGRSWGGRGRRRRHAYGGAASARASRFDLRRGRTERGATGPSPATRDCLCTSETSRSSAVAPRGWRCSISRLSLRSGSPPRRFASETASGSYRPAGRTAWPGVRIVDMRGSGATLSSTLIEACRRYLDEGRRVGVVANRLGYATAVSCTRCGTVKRCPKCDLPLGAQGPGWAPELHPLRPQGGEHRAVRRVRV